MAWGKVQPSSTSPRHPPGWWRTGLEALRDYQAQRDAMCLDTFMISDSLAAFDSDLDVVQRLHRDLSAAVARQTRVLEGLDGQPSPSPRGVVAGSVAEVAASSATAL